MPDDEDFVETSDVEELAEELEKENMERLRRSSPRRDTTPDLLNEEDMPRKRAKLFHEAHNTAEKDFPMFSTTPTSPFRTQSSSTVPTPGSPTASFLMSSRSPTRTPASPKESLPKLQDDIPAIGYTPSSPNNYSQDPLLLYSPLQSPQSQNFSTSQLELHSPQREIQRETDITDPLPSDIIPLGRSTTPQLPYSELHLPQHPSVSSPDLLAFPRSLSPSHFVPRSPDDKNIPSPSRTSQPFVDDLFNFSPIKPITPSSPLTPSASPLREDGALESRMSSPQKHGKSLSPMSPQRHPSPLAAQPLEADDAAAAAALAEEQQGSRYSLRRRNAAQIAPYTVESILYRDLLKNNPQAIVKIKNFDERTHHRHPADRYEEEGETQRDGYVLDPAEAVEEDAEWEQRERRRRRTDNTRESSSSGARVEPTEGTSRYPGFLLDSPSTDDEEREMDAASKEAKKILRAKERQAKAREKEERRQRRNEEEEHRRREREKLRRPKSYPLSKAKHSLTGPLMRPGQASSSSSRGDIEPGEGHPQSRHATPAFSVLYFSAQRELEDEELPVPSSLDKDRIVRAYFNEGDDFDMYGAADSSADHFNEPGPSPSHSPSRSPPHFFASARRDSPEDVMVISDDEEEDGNAKRLRRLSQSSGGSSDIQIDLARDKKRLLNKMMPKSLINKMAVEGAKGLAAKRKRKRIGSPSLNPDYIGPLRPGQSRARKSATAQDIKDIKGDSESEDEVRRDSLSESSTSSANEESEPDSDSVEILKTYRHASPKREPTECLPTDIIEVDSEEDEDIQFFVQNQLPSRRRSGKTKLRDQSLIDYMLPRTYTTGGPRRKRHKSERGPLGERSSSYKYDIITNDARGLGRERQTLLSFDVHEKKRRRRRSSGGDANRPHSHVRSSGPSMARTSSVSTNVVLFDRANRQDTTSDDRVHVVHGPTHMSRKEREKLRKAKAKGNGVWHIRSGGRIETGRRTNAAQFTVDLENDGFYAALAPISSGGHLPRNYEPPSDKNSKSGRSVPSKPSHPESQEHIDLPKFLSQDLPAVRQKRTTTGDLDIKPLHSGKSFGPSTYIGKGHLQELINVMSRTSGPILPSSIELCGFDVGPQMGVKKLCTTLPNVFEAIFDFATGLPDPDVDTLCDQWKLLTRGISQLASYYLTTVTDKEKVLLCHTVEREIGRVVNRIEKLALSFVDTPILILCWFLVELSCRLDGQLATSYSTLSASLQASSKALTRLLLQFGIDKTLDSIRTDGNMEGTSTVLYATELWVCLIHVLNGEAGAPAKSKGQPFWGVFLACLQAQAMEVGQEGYFVASENIWLSIFTICAISQFSTYGMTTADFRLQACWELAAFALKKISLAEHASHQRLHSNILRQRDHYISLVTIRCSILSETWKWRLDDASVMFNQLAEIFRSRNFANLLHEKDNQPMFFGKKDWTLLSSFDSQDTAFATFLKLIIRADRDEANTTSKKPSSRMKKLLSLAVPLGNLAFSVVKPATGWEATPFYNRISAVAVAVYLDANGYDDRTSKARNYIPFATADPKTRHTIICGFLRLAILMLKRQIRMDAMLDWAEEMAKVSVDELTVAVKEKTDLEGGKENDALLELQDAAPVDLMRHLLYSAHTIAKYYLDNSLPPDLGLLSCLDSILTSPIAKTTVLKDVTGKFLDTLLTARSKVLPKPERPVRTPPSNPDTEDESQDYFSGMDDMDGIDFSALDDHAPVLDVVTTSPANQPPKNEDRFTRSLVNFTLTAYAHLKPYLQSPPPSNVSFKEHADRCDLWLRLLLCCFEAKPSVDKWQNYFSLTDGYTNAKDVEGVDHDGTWGYRVKLSTMYQLLQLDPKVYETYNDRAIEVLFLALVSESANLENEYVSLVLSIDCLAHPLLVNITGLPDRNTASGDYKFSLVQFEELRMRVIEAIFNNIDCSLIREEADNEFDSSKHLYVGFCFKMLSRMRSIRSTLLRKSNEEDQKTTKYTEFCLQVLRALQETHQLRSQGRLSFFLDWARTLSVPQ